jgi:hypothetical protein
MLSNTCSGTPQSALEFSQTFGKFHGTAPTASSSTAVQPATESTDPLRLGVKALYSIPGEPGGAPALGSPAVSRTGSSGSSGASASPSPGS